jgi:hypothetical protein
LPKKEERKMSKLLEDFLETTFIIFEDEISPEAIVAASAEPGEEEEFDPEEPEDRP